MSSEKDTLQRFLDAQRNHVLEIVDGLDDDQLRQPVLPSGWTCLGMLKHLSLADEHYWFRAIVGGQSLDFFPREADGDWQVGTEEDPLNLYREEIRHSDECIAATDVHAPPRQRDPLWDEWGMDFPDLRYIMLHVIGETAVHAGHLDAVRELIDGRQYIVL